MLAELITLRTVDGLTHFGALYGIPQPAKLRDLAVVLVHGLTGSCVGEVESALPPMLAQAGYACLVANHRGQDFFGSATERFAGCLPDIEAAMHYIAARGFVRIALVGYSKGGVKVAY